MSTLKYYAAPLLLFIMLFNACKKDECTGRTTISYTTIDDFGGFACGNVINDQTRGYNYIVSNQSALETLVECDSLPLIDFEKYVLLLGSYESENDLSYKGQALVRDCETQLLTYTISYNSEGRDTSVLVDYHAIIPKVPDSYEIKFAIEVWQLN